VRLVGLGLLYFLALASKEIGVTLPGALLLLELAAPRLDARRTEPAVARVRREGATWLLLGVVLAAYLGLRFFVLGTVTGEQVAPTLRAGRSRGARASPRSPSGSSTRGCSSSRRISSPITTRR
jgi:hypothetical protein